MNDGNQLVEALSALAPSLARLEKSESAKVRYELLSGSLIWSDELPSDSGPDKDCLRYVLKYRTGLIIGEPESAFATVWQEAVRLFPTWIGFLPERTTYSHELADFYHSERSRLFKQLGLDE